MIDLKLLRSVVNKPVPSMVDIIGPASHSTSRIFKFKTKEELKILKFYWGFGGFFHQS